MSEFLVNGRYRAVDQESARAIQMVVDEGLKLRGQSKWDGDATRDDLTKTIHSLILGQTLYRADIESVAAVILNKYIIIKREG